MQRAQDKRSTEGARDSNSAPQPPQPTPKLSDQAMRQAEHIVRAVWGHLPQKLKEEMQQVFKEKMLPAYEVVIRQYFRTIAEQQR